MGTARMGKYPENSIVDENLQIHGVNNCFVLSAAVFPTGSNSNPTFTVLTLARKLIDYITKI
jgi:choline dehydrogenase-like flavoprotein